MFGCKKTCFVQIKVRENRSGNQEWTIQRNWKHWVQEWTIQRNWKHWVHKTQDENKQKHNTENKRDEQHGPHQEPGGGGELIY